MTTYERTADAGDFGAAPGETTLLQGEPPPAAEPDEVISADEPFESTSETSLFADDELAALRARWDSVQAAFVDDPRECVATADGLVSDLIERLTAGFADVRSRLETRWARGETASTEDLRLGLQYYREFFQRLLEI